MEKKGGTGSPPIVVLSEASRRHWLRSESYPEIHRRFEISYGSLSQDLTHDEAVLLVEDDLLRNGAGRVRRFARRPGRLALPVILVGDGEGLETSPERDLVLDVVERPPSEASLLRALRTASQFLEVERRVFESQSAAEQRARELEELNAIGIALSAERDHDRLLNLILTKSRAITRADAGSLFLVAQIDMPIGKEDKAGNQARARARWLRFRLAQNDSREFLFEEEVLPIAADSIAGYVAGTGETLNLDDAYDPPADKPFSINRSFDEATGYRTRSVLVMPMRNHDGETIGVLQLINKKTDAGIRLTSPESFDRHVISFTPLDERLVSSLASQAAVAVENNALYQQIEHLFANFVEAAVRTIESRDPVTKGHSRRVAKMTERLALVANEESTGPFRDFHLDRDQIRELKYAALLHDFGKVGVNEKILVKATKLYSGRMDAVRERFQCIKRTLEVERLRKLLARWVGSGEPIPPEELEKLERELAHEMEAVDEALEVILAANQPTVTHYSDFGPLESIARRRFPGLDGELRPFLEPRELQALKLTKGTLTPAEREQIKAHVVHTYEFLSLIPWTRDLQAIPKLARSHHEKLDGSGYPFGLSERDIPPQTRMMTIADIFDALAAQDRPYKPPVPVESALDILREEARHGALDDRLLTLFIEARVFELIRQG